MLGFGPPSAGKTKSLLLENNWLALTIVKFTVLLLPFCEELFVADKLTGEEGQ